MKNRVISFLVTILLTAGIGSSIPVLPDGETNSPANEGAFRTIMIYMVGSDLESSYSLASEDIQEMLDSNIDVNRVNVVIAAGGTTSWPSLGLENGQMSVFRLSRNSNSLIQLDEISVRNMGSSDTLSYFLRLAASACPADRYDLILWDHGGGPLYGFGLDSASEDSMQLDELMAGLANAGFGNGRKLEMIGFDACLMGSIEVAALMAPYAEYMVASEEVVPGTGWDYSFLRDRSIYHESAEKMIRTICTSFEKSFRYYSNQPDYTLSGLDLRQASAVWQAMDTLFLGNSGSFSPGDYPAIAACIHSSCSFSRFSSGGEYDLFDLIDFTDRLSALSPARVKNLQGSLKSMVICSVSNMKGAEGISFYYPMYAPENASAYLNNICRLLRSQGLGQNYPAFLQACITGQTGGNSLPLPTVQGTVTPGATQYAVQLTPEQHASFVRGFYYIVTPYQNEPDAYRMVERCEDINLDRNGVLMVSRERKFHYFRLNPSEPWAEVTLYGQEARNGIIRYLMLMNLSRMPFDRPNDWVSGGMRLQLEVSAKNMDGTLMWLVPETSHGMAARELLELEPGDIVFSVWPVLRKSYDQHGNVLPYHEWPKWNPNGTQGLDGIVTEAHPETAWRTGEAGRDYYIQLVMLDTTGKAWATDLIKMQ